MFNLVPCANDYENAFADFCDQAPDVVAFAKNAGPQKLMLDYLKPDGAISFYVPDFFVRSRGGACYLVELKGKTDELVPLKAATAREWCKAASRHTPWRYLYVPYHLFQTSPSATVEELERACLPSLSALDKEAATSQSTLPLDEETAHKKALDRLEEFVRAAGFKAVPSEYENAVRQAVETLDFAISKKHQTYGSAFTPLFGPLDRLAIGLVSCKLRPHIPADHAARDLYFDPVGGYSSEKDAALLKKHQGWLKSNLVFGRSMQKLATLLFCLRYAHEWSIDGGGIWDDVRDEFSGKEFGLLLEVLDQVNNLRNTKLVHEGELTDAGEATAELTRWIGCICLMSALS